MECPACHSPNIDGARFCAKCGALLPAQAEEADPLIGAIVGGRYRISGVLGEGGMGRVYTGEQQMGTTVRKVAVKTLLSQYAKDPQVVARFMRECGTVSELEHPNTIKVYDFGQTDSGDLYIAMELLSGESLEAMLEKGPIAGERVDKILGQVCGSLQEAHDKGIIHRDLKPANIFLTTRAGEEDYVKVLDFGIAKKDEKHSKHEQKLTQQGTVLGTPPYMSPEQFKGQELDTRSDIYSLGVMAYEMLTGRLPFEADTPWDWATQHMIAQPHPFEATPLGNNVPPKMRAAVMRALSKKKEERQQSVRQFYEEFTMGGVGMPRPSLLGTARASFPEAGGTSPGLVQGPVSGSAQTQIGTPIFVTGPQQPAAHTMIDSSGGFPAQGAGGAPAQTHHGAPTGGGQVFAPPPSTQKKKSNAGPIIGIAAVVGVAVIVGGVLLMKKGSSNGDDVTTTIALPSASQSAVVMQDTPPDTTADPATSASAASDSTGSGTAPSDTGKTATTAKTGSGTTTTPSKPAVDPKAAQECSAATSLAYGGNVGLAVNHYRNCDGPGRAAARAAIDSAAQRKAALGCSGMADAKAAASIGASTALNMLKKKGCK